MNRVADCLSHYYENDGPDDHHPDHNFVSTDAKLDPDGELVPVQWYTDMHTTATRQSTCLVEKAEQQVLESNQMNKGAVDQVDDPNADPDPLAFTSGADAEPLCVCVERNVNLTQLV